MKNVIVLGCVVKDTTLKAFVSQCRLRDLRGLSKCWIGDGLPGLRS